MQITFFLGLMVYADVFGSSGSDALLAVNPNFIGSEENQIGINPDNINISDSGDDFSIISYIVQEGDTLEKISKEFWVPINDLKKLNKIGGEVKPWMKLIVSDNEEWILYVVQKEWSLKLFAEFYRLNLEDLMTLNYISDDSEILYPWQELFVNITEQRAYDIGLLEKAQPILPKDELPKKPTKKATTSKTIKSSWVTQASSETPAVSTNNGKSGIISRWYYNPKISNGFAVGYCTWYAAIKSPNIFKYTSDSKQERPFGGNARNWYANAKAAGHKVWQTPRVGAIIVYSALRSSAGHVGIVREYYPDQWKMVIEDMNYAGRYIVTKRWENVNRSGIVGYIYQ